MGQRRPAADKVVPVGSAFRVKAGVEIRQRGAGRKDPDIPGEKAVQGPDKTPRRNTVDIGLEIGDLPRCVDSRVGSALTDQGHMAAVDLFQSVFQGSLHGAAPILALPAGKIRSVIGDKQLYVSQSVRGQFQQALC